MKDGKSITISRNKKQDFLGLFQKIWGLDFEFYIFKS
jgi:hypothetical protein